MGMVKKVLSGLILLLTFFWSSSAAQDAIFEASARILETISVTKNADLVFGTIVPDTSQDGFVTVQTNGRRQCDAHLTCLDSYSRADFTVSGKQNAKYWVTLPEAGVLSSGEETMEIDNFTSNLLFGWGTLYGGTDDFKVGARIKVKANQQPGDYIGTFAVTVEYE